MKNLQKSIKTFIIVMIVTILLIVGGTVFLNYKLKKSEPYRKAINYIENNPQLISEIGAIKDYDYLISGNAFGKDQTATFRINVIGEKKSKRVYIDLRKDKNWEVVRFEFR